MTAPWVISCSKSRGEGLKPARDPAAQERAEVKAAEAIANLKREQSHVKAPFEAAVDAGRLLPDGSFQLRWTDRAGPFAFEASVDLIGWLELTNFVMTAEGGAWIDAPAKGLSRRFYRMRSR